MTSITPYVITRLERDVALTVGERHRARVAAAARNIAALDVVHPGSKLVDDVQQELHDTFVDTTWPACPRHGRHPLWYHDDGWWWCEQDRVAVCRLGEFDTRHPVNDDGGTTG